MAIDRISTAAQTAYFLSQIQNAGAALDKTQAQIASGDNATTYAGFGSQTQVLTATISANARNTAYTDATKFAVTQVSLQDTQLSPRQRREIVLCRQMLSQRRQQRVPSLIASARRLVPQQRGLHRA